MVHFGGRGTVEVALFSAVRIELQHVDQPSWQCSRLLVFVAGVAVATDVVQLSRHISYHMARLISVGVIVSPVGIARVEGVGQCSWQCSFQGVVASDVDTLRGYAA